MRLLSSIFFLLVLASSCKIPTQKSENQDLVLNLRWSKAFPDHTEEEVEIGILWSLSYLGAALPPSEATHLLQWKDKRVVSADLNHAGFSPNAENVLSQLIRQMKSSEEYLKLGSISAGRFIQLTFNSTWHYYAITDVPTSLSLMLGEQSFAPAVTFKKGQSGVAYGKRLVFLPDSTHSNVQDWVFYANEGQDSAGSFVPQEYEVFDIMSNGQPRFAIYDSNGKLKKGADPKLSKAGKPAKCMWCHEGKTLSSFRRDLPPHLTAFNKTVHAFSAKIRAFQGRQETSILHDSVGHHRRAEFLFASLDESHPIFIEEEYGMSPESLDTFLQRLESHTTPHFPEFEKFYHLDDLNHLPKYDFLEIPTHMWETSAYEPNLLR